MPTYYGDSYGGVMAAERADRNARSAKHQDALRLVMGLRQQHVANQMAEKQFQASQEVALSQLAQQQKAFEQNKTLLYKGMEADAARLEFEKEKFKVGTQEAADYLKFNQEQIKANNEVKIDQAKKKEAESIYNQVRSMGVAVDPFDADQLFGDTIDPKRKDLLVRETNDIYEEQKKRYDMASSIAELLNAQSDLKRKTEEYAKNETTYGKHVSKVAERKANETNLLRLKELKARTAAYLDPDGQLSKRAMPFITVDENGLYVPLIQKPKTFRELNPQSGDSGAGLGKVRELDREEPEPVIQRSAPQSYDEATGFNPADVMMSAGLTPQPLPMTPPGAPVSRPMWDMGIGAPPVTDPRLELVKGFQARGVPRAQAIVMADEALKGMLLQQQMNAGRFRP